MPENWFPSKNSNRRGNRNFDNPVQIVPLESEVSGLKLFIWWKELKIPAKIVFVVILFSGHLECSSRTHAKILILKSFLSRAQMSKENQQNSRLSSNWIFLKLFDGQEKRKFWQLYWNNFTKIWNFFDSKWETDKKNHVFREILFFARDCSGHKECNFDIPADKSSAVVKVFLLWKFKRLEEIVYCSGKCFFFKKIAGLKKCSSDNFAEIFARL